MSNFLRIQSAPTPENSAIRLHQSDNVAIARVPLSPGSELTVGGVSVRVTEPIAAGHKLALTSIAPGEAIRRYGCRIGRAMHAIAGRTRTSAITVSVRRRIWKIRRTGIAITTAGTIWVKMRTATRASMRLAARIRSGWRLAGVCAWARAHALQRLAVRVLGSGRRRKLIQF